MARLACIDLPAFPLQLLLRQERERRPLAVVEHDRPQARLLWVGESARGRGVLPGMRYAAALSLCPDLRARPVPADEIQAGVSLVAERLRAFGPDVEPSPGDPGVFWMDLRGLGSAEAWTASVEKALHDARFKACVVVGWGRFSTYAIARALSESLVLRDREEERERLHAVPLSRLRIEPAVRDSLAALGVKTVGALLSLPADGLRDRFGEAAHALHAAAREDGAPVVGDRPDEPLRATAELEYGEREAGRLLFEVKRLLDPLLARLAERRLALASLVLELELEDHARREEHLRPADPTLDARFVLDLVLLRLESSRLSCGVVSLALQVEGAAAEHRQLEWFADAPRRDARARRRAIARLRAEFGADSVVRAVLCDAHLPEARFSWAPADEPPRPRARVSRRVLVRRMCAAPRVLPFDPRRLPREDASLCEFRGPYRLAGGWWKGGVSRDYYFARTREGRWLWLFRDSRRRRWFLQGRVE